MGRTINVAESDLTLQRFFHWEKHRANEIFLTQPVGGGAVRNLSWAEAGNEVRRMANWLKKGNYPAGSRIAILGKNSAHWILSDLAIWMAGHVSVPIYPTFNAESLRYILEHSEARACFIGKMDDTGSLKTGIPKGVELITLPLAPSLPSSVEASNWDALIAETAPLDGLPVRDGEELCTIVYTSGTTGNPKGVMHKFSSFAWVLKSASYRVALSESDRFISYLPLAHVAERILIEQGAIRHGSHIFFAESLNTFVQDLQRAKPTIFFSVPRLWVKFQQGVLTKLPQKKLDFLLRIPLLNRLIKRKILSGLGLDKCRLAIGGAAPMSVEILRWYRALGLDLIEVYGMTENSAASHSTLPGVSRPGTIGLPLEGVESRLDKDSGEIQMFSPALMLGYYKDAEQTAGALTEDGWLHTGDKGQFESDGYLRITGRVKDIFKTSKGKYIAPAPIEHSLIAHPDVEACVVAGANLDQPVGIVLLSPEAAARNASPAARGSLLASMEKHLTSINAKLEPHEQLSLIAIVTTPWTPENGFVTPTMKIKRAKIDDTYSARFTGWLQKKQKVVWAED